MNKLAPSILAADFNVIGNQISIVEDAGADFLHIDVMDGMFVPAISFGMPLITSIRKNSKMIFDTHLMIEDPIRYVQVFKEAGADILTVHAEACTHLNKVISAIKDADMKAGVALNPATSLDCLRYIISDIDLLLVMSVNPGFGGQKFISSTYKKLMDARKLINDSNPDCMLEVDGGITLENAAGIIKAGADVLVSGSSIFKGDIRRNVISFKEVLECC